jgi:hypothetical protein
LLLFGKSFEKTQCNQLQLHKYGILIVDCDKKRVFEYSKLIQICGSDTDDTDDINEIVITIL